MARKFLYFIAFCIILVIAGLFALRIFQDDLTRVAFVPDEEFVEQEALATNAYEDYAMWYARPGKAGDDPTRFTPLVRAAEEGTDGQAPDELPPVRDAFNARYAVFFVHPTSYLDKASWNAPLGNAQAEGRARLFLTGMASPFNGAAEIWAPKYRQATFGAFLTDEPAAQMALDSAYRDVAQAFDVFLAEADPSLPIVLAGHSQGAWHILTLLREKVAETGAADRIAMIYPVGWPISVGADLPALPYPACEGALDTACIMTWSSFAEPADAGLVMERYSATPGFTGEPRGDGAILCINPITGSRNGEAPASENLGTLVPDDDMADGELVLRAVPARCDAQGLLLIGDPLEMGPGVLPGNNYHVYDIPLFWRNLQADVTRRVNAFAGVTSNASVAVP